MNEQNRLLCGHLITHIDPEIDQILQEKLGVNFSTLETLNTADWAQFGQLGVDAKWVLDNIDQIEEVWGNIIASQKAWNDAVVKLSKKGFGAIESIDKGAVDLAIALTGRNSKLLEGEDRKKNAVDLQAKLRANNSEFDRIANGVTLARSLAELNEAREKAANEPEVQAGIRAWRQQAKQTAKAAKMGLQHGLAAFSHPQYPGNDGQFTGSDWEVSSSNQSWGQSSFASKPQQAIGGSKQDSIAFNWSGSIAGKTKQFSSNVVKGVKKIGKWFGIG